VGTDKTVALTSSYTGADVGNYTITDQATTTADITAKAITISGITASDKIYDATRTATVDTTKAAGWIAGDTVSVSATGLFDNKNVGTGKTVSLASNYSGSDVSNYAITDQATTTADISQKAIAISGITAADKVYDANNNAAVDSSKASGWIAGDTVSVSATGLFDNKNVGTGKTVSLASSYSGSDVSNYAITDQATTTADITAKAITISGITASDKVYDAAKNATVDSSKAAGWIAGDTLSVSATGLFDNKNVGTDKTVTLTSSYTGADVGNYAITDQMTTSADITAKPISISGITAANKVYDATTSANTDVTNATGWIAGDAFAVSATGLFDNKNVGTGKTVTLTSSYSGADVTNYAITDQATTSADITAKAITIAGITAADKIYDATKNATVDATGATGWIAGDAFGVSATGAFDNKNVGTGKTVTLTSNYTGADVTNYTITDQATTGADITTKAITIAGITAADKVYDANTNATVNTTGASGWIAGDTVNVSATGLFDNKNAGTDKTVTLTSSYTGADVDNYTITDQAATNADITQANLNITANNDRKSYDAQAYHGGNGVTYEGFVGGETEAVLGGALDYAGSSQGAVNAGTYVITPVGMTSNNYAISFIDGILTINPADLTVLTGSLTGSVAKVYDGNNTATLNPGNYSITGWKGADGATVTKTVGTYDYANAGENKMVTVSLLKGDYSPTGGTILDNYSLPTLISGAVGSVSPAPLTITANNDGKTYDAKPYSGGNGVIYAGFVAGETSGVLGGSLAYAGNSQGAKNVGAYTITPEGLTSGNYDITFAGGVLTVNPKNLTAVYTAANKVYDATTAAEVAGSSSDIILGDAVAFAQTAAFADKNAQAGKIVNVSGIALTGAEAANYSLQNTTAVTTADITPAPLTLTAQTNTKTYDGTTTASAIPTVSGLKGSDTATGLIETYADKNAGTGKTINVSGYIINDGAGGNNYTVTTIADTTGVIDKAGLTITANNDAKFVSQADQAGYDGVSYGGFVNGETSAVLTALPTVARTNRDEHKAGEYIGVLVPDGAVAMNYSMTYTAGNYTIVPAQQLLVKVESGAMTYGVGPAYNINAVQYLSGGNVVTDLTPESATGHTYVYNDGAAGTVTFTLIPDNEKTSTSGNLAVGNYAIAVKDFSKTTGNLTSDSATITGNLSVNQKDLTAAYTAINKVYDGTTAATVNGTSGDIIAGDTVTFSQNTNFTDKSVNTGKAVHVTDIAIGGADAGNYALQNTQATATADITAKPIVISGITAENKVYDAATSATVDATGATGWIAGDAFGVNATGAFDNKNVGAGKTVNLTSHYTGADVGNYAITDQATTNADITPAPLTVTADNAAKTYGETITFAGTEFISNGLIANETIGLVTLASAGSVATAGVAGSPYAIVASDAKGGTFIPANYSITYKDGALTVNPAALTVTANDDKKIFNNLPYKGGAGVVYTGFVNDETSTVLGGVVDYGGTSQGAVQGGTYNIAPFGLTSANYVIAYRDGTLTITVPVNENVDASQTSSQNGINGTQQGQGGNPGAPNSPSMGPGAGSGNVIAPPLAPPPPITGAVLTTPTFSTPVTISTTGQTMTLTVAGSAATGPMTEVGALPVFTQSGGAPPTLQGNFMLQQSGSAVSLTPTAPTGASVAPPTDITGEKSAPFTLTLENGTTLQMTATVTPDGVLVVSAPDAAGSIDVRQAILMGAQVVKQALNVELGSLSSALFVRN
jgi:hypothetical protein